MRLSGLLLAGASRAETKSGSRSGSKSHHDGLKRFTTIMRSVLCCAVTGLVFYFAARKAWNLTHLQTLQTIPKPFTERSQELMAEVTTSLSGPHTDPSRNVLVVSHAGPLPMDELYPCFDSFREHNSAAHIALILDREPTREQADFLRRYSAVAYVYSEIYSMYAPVLSRFDAQLLWLDEHQGRFDHVLHVDTDTYYQADPFSTINNYDQGLVLFGETNRSSIGQCKYHRRWIWTCHGKSTLDAVWENHRYCAGTIIGNVTAYRALLNALTRHFPRCNDQGMLNVLLHTGYLDQIAINVWLETFHDGPVATLSASTMQMRKHLAVHADGSPYTIVHQFNRHPQYEDMLKRLYPLNGGALQQTPNLEVLESLESEWISCHYLGGCSACGSVPCPADMKITVVTAIYDLGLGDLAATGRMEELLQSANATLKMNVPMMIYAPAIHHDWVKDVRGDMPTIVQDLGHHNFTLLNVLPKIESMLSGPTSQQLFARVENRSAIQSLLDFTKFTLLNHTATENLFNTKYFVWVDIESGSILENHTWALWNDTSHTKLMDQGQIIVQLSSNASSFEYDVSHDLLLAHDSSGLLESRVVGGLASVVDRLEADLAALLMLEWIERRQMINGVDQALSVLYARDPNRFHLLHDLASTDNVG